MVKQTPGLLKGMRWLMPASALLMFGCPNEKLALIEPCTVAAVNNKITTQASDKVDLLFMVDNSGSMKEEQANLAIQLPNLAKILATGVLKLPNGMTKEFPPVKSLHIGVITSDMGINGVTGIESCNDLGNDGILQTTAMGFQVDPATSMLTTTPCAAATTIEANSRHLNFIAGTTNPDAFGIDFGCLTQLGTRGCGFEQQLESIYKALAPASEKVFTNGSGGHGDNTNKGFLRDDSIVAVIAVSDEEDCSIPDSSREVFAPSPTDPKFKTPEGKPQGVNSRCALHAADGTLHDTKRYIDGLRKLRKDDPSLVIFAAIAGIPIAAEEMKTTVDGVEVQDFDQILALPDMQIKFDKADPVMFASASGALPDPACETANGKASPARRFLEVAKGFGANGIVRSICQSDFSGALSAIIEKVAAKLSGACLDRPKNLNADGLVECDIVEYLPLGMMTCNKDRGRVDADPDIREVDGQKRKVCKINQVAVDRSAVDAALRANPMGVDPSAVTGLVKPNMSESGVVPGLKGWYYDYFTKDVKENCTAENQQQRIGFLPGSEQEGGSQVRFECLQPVFSSNANSKGKEAVNRPCEGKPGTKADALYNDKADSCMKFQDAEFDHMRCEPKRNTCQIMCKTNADCPESWVCAKTAGDSVGFCVNPICPASSDDI